MTFHQLGNNLLNRRSIPTTIIKHLGIEAIWLSRGIPHGVPTIKKQCNWIISNDCFCAYVFFFVLNICMSMFLQLLLELKKTHPEFSFREIWRFEFRRHLQHLESHVHVTGPGFLPPN